MKDYAITSPDRPDHSIADHSIIKLIILP